MTKLEMVKIALKDFKKFGESKKCRFYKNIISALRVIPCGVSNPNKLTEFYEFIPANMRKGVQRERVVEIVFQFYVGYSEAMSNEELKKIIQNRYKKLYYQKNKEKVLAIVKNSYLKHRKKRIAHLRKKYYEDPKYHSARYSHKKQEWRHKNKDTINIYQLFNKMANSDKKIRRQWIKRD